MDTITYEKIESEVNRLAQIILAPEDSLPQYGLPNSEKPYVIIELDSKIFFEQRVDHGKVLFSIYATSLDDLLYSIFDYVTETMSYNYSRMYDDGIEDWKRLKFRKKLELLRMLSTEWEQRELRIQQLTTHESMFNDNAGKKQAYLEELMGNGFLRHEAILKVNERFSEKNL